MEDWLLQVKEDWNKTSDSAWYQSLRTEEKIKALVEVPEGAFHPAVYDLIQKYIPNLTGKKVLLPSSGDNHAAFFGIGIVRVKRGHFFTEYSEEILK